MCAFHLSAVHIATSVYNNIIEYYLSGKYSTGVSICDYT